MTNARRGGTLALPAPAAPVGTLALPAPATHVGQSHGGQSIPSIADREPPEIDHDSMPAPPDHHAAAVTAEHRVVPAPVPNGSTLADVVAKAKACIDANKAINAKKAAAAKNAASAKLLPSAAAALPPSTPTTRMRVTGKSPPSAMFRAAPVPVRVRTPPMRPAVAIPESTTIDEFIAGLDLSDFPDWWAAQFLDPAVAATITRGAFSSRAYSFGKKKVSLIAAKRAYSFANQVWDRVHALR